MRGNSNRSSYRYSFTPSLPLGSVTDEGTADGSIGNGWSSTAVTNWPGYGYVHGSCSGCGSTYALFGASAQVSKTWTGLPSHTSITLSVRVWYIDSWDSEKMYIDVDNSQVWSSAIHTYAAPAAMARRGRVFIV